MAKAPNAQAQDSRGNGHRLVANTQRIHTYMSANETLTHFALGYRHETISGSLIVHADCFEWLGSIPANSLHAIITDPPYGVKEYNFDQMEKRANGNGGVWRIPPSFDGHTRAPLPRFTALNANERATLYRFFVEWARQVTHALRPGGHVLLASNAFLSQLVFSALVEGSLEFRGELIRLVRTLRGGDRPKNAEDEFPDVCSLPRGCYEPWGIFRKPLPAHMTVSDCLREFQTGGLRRRPDGNPFSDVVLSERTPRRERNIADHPSLKPQSFLRQLVYAALPLGEGVIADPFMGSGSTVAAAEAMGVHCVGVERFADYYDMSRTAIPRLAALKPRTEAQAELADLGQDMATTIEQLPFSFE
ncbi:MAG: DNA modification methyltransferase [Ktedonobacterales bacterium]|jgi:site-specific DNA-methyltransferase (adenine-specific)|nr:MAG: DNA modification methyltransferase [Ktedonobacterales bacterium]